MYKSLYGNIQVVGAMAAHIHPITVQYFELPEAQSFEGNEEVK